MILYIEYPKDSTKRLFETLTNTVKMQDTKINVQKWTALLYTKNNISEK